MLSFEMSHLSSTTSVKEVICRLRHYFFQTPNFMKLILNIYDHGVVMHVKFYKGVISYRVVIAFNLPKFQWFFHPQP